ncbi:hypothetical protein, partial [Sphingobium sp. OAS761]|uniref:hypothetical protein n=1 Tax=Sphingobium sp. OAS761 TaxID=2817901 RepID=UPI00209D3328
LGNAVFAAQAIQHDPDFVLGREVAPGCAPNVLKIRIEGVQKSRGYSPYRSPAHCVGGAADLLDDPCHRRPLDR